MNGRDALRTTQRRLEDVGIPDAALEAEVLLMHAASITREQLYAALVDPLAETIPVLLAPLVERRLEREPLAYVTGHREFFGLELLVDSRAMVPRQETETLVEQTLTIVGEQFRGGVCTIADVGTGSGAITVGLAVALPAARIVATDVSEAALELAWSNCHRHGVTDQVTLACGDLLNSVSEPLDVVVANLPYVPWDEWPALQPEIRRYEPWEALVPGQTGLEAVLRLLGQIEEMPRRPYAVALELGDGQAPIVVQEAGLRFPEASLRVYRDLAGLERGLVVEELRAL